MNLTQCLCLSPEIRGEKYCGGDYMCRATCVPWSWPEKNEVLGKLYCFIGSSGKTNTYLKGRDCSWRILSPWCQHTALAAIGILLVVRNSGKQVHKRGIFLATMRYITLELWTITLLSSLCPNDGPNHFFLCPIPSQAPTGSVDVPIHLIVVHRYRGLVVLSNDHGFLFVSQIFLLV